jgi:hypothetical protein
MVRIISFILFFFVRLSSCAHEGRRAEVGSWCHGTRLNEMVNPKGLSSMRRTFKYCNGELNHSPYLRKHCSQYSMSLLISITSASSTCQCASSDESTLTRSDLASCVSARAIARGQRLSHPRFGNSKGMRCGL